MAPLFTGNFFGFGRPSSGGAGPSPFYASGGTLIEDSGYRYHVFFGPGTLEVTGSGPAKVLLVAGGGGGGNGQSGGGGGGGAQYASDVSLSGNYTIAIGNGGARGTGQGYTNSGAEGSNTTFGPPTDTGDVTAIGGGGGLRNNWAYDGETSAQGGCGGGAGGGGLSDGPSTATAPGEPQPSPPSFTAYGNVGGAHGNTSGGVGGGGGGAGAVGSKGGTSGEGEAGAGQPFPEFPVPIWAPKVAPAMNGGIPSAYVSTAALPVVVTQLTPTDTIGPTSDFYGGGGLGGGSPTVEGDNVRAHGGGGSLGIANPNAPSGSPDETKGACFQAVDHLGGGGAGSRRNSSGGQGGTGICIVKYQKEGTVSKATGATGGMVFDEPGQPGVRWHVFVNTENNDTFTVDNPTGITADVLLVAGGGAGGSDYGAGGVGGGGGGGVVYRPAMPLAAGDYPLTVGAGGMASTTADSNPSPVTGGNGEDTSFGTVATSSWPANSLVAKGGGGGANAGGNSANAGAAGGSGGGGASPSGSGGARHCAPTNPQSLPTASITYGHGGEGRQSDASPSDSRGGGGGGGGGPTATSGQGNENQGGKNGYQVPSPFIPSNMPQQFERVIGGNCAPNFGGAILRPSPEWRYFAGGGGASDNDPGTSNTKQGSGGLGGGGNAGDAGRGSPTNPRASCASNGPEGSENWPQGNGGTQGTACGVFGRGGGGSGNGIDSPVNQWCRGGMGGPGCIIIKVTSA